MSSIGIVFRDWGERCGFPTNSQGYHVLCYNWTPLQFGEPVSPLSFGPIDAIMKGIGSLTFAQMSHQLRRAAKVVTGRCHHALESSAPTDSAEVGATTMTAAGWV